MDYQVVHKQDHWEGYIEGEFYCSGDTFNEVADEVLKKVYGEVEENNGRSED